MSKIAIITEVYPRLSETFIRKQAYKIGGFVFAYKIAQEILNKQDKQLPKIVDLSDNIPTLYKKIYWWSKVILWKVFKYPGYHWIPNSKSTLKKRLQEMDIHVVLAQFGTTGINVMNVCKELSIPLVVHFHGKDASQLLQNKYYSHEIKQLLKIAVEIIVVNQNMRQIFLDFGFPKEKIHFIPCGVEVPLSCPYKQNSPHSPFRFLAIGRLVEKKAPLNTIKAFELCAKKHPNVSLTFVGDGELLEEVESYVSKSDYKNKIFLKGPLPHIQVQKELLKADAFVQHSIVASNGDAEGWPLTVGEAGAYGLPVISTKHMGITSQVVEGVTGFLVEEGDVKEMGKKMIEIASFKPEKYNTFSKMAYKHIKEHGNNSIQISKLQDVLNKHITKK
ncbi:glycosyltransferase [Flammeovirgaceae bacterium SG7u.111]|nr:glycosyltransferase [Flammeovirgaceae bacterium SG7u.132]WPO38248.1 glycosyltransferase [Flammeovirgaceae bacterium SG7u.111]